jgi:hypothetical protein
VPVNVGFWHIVRVVAGHSFTAGICGTADKVSDVGRRVEADGV